MKFFPPSRLMFLALFGLALNISISVAEILAGLLLIEWFWRAVKSWKRTGFQQDQLFKTPLDIPIFLFVLWTLVLVVFQQTTGIRDMLSNQSALLLFFWAANALNKIEKQKLQEWLCWGSVFVGFWGILQYVGKVNYLPFQRTFVIPEFMTSWPQWLVHELALNNERAQGFRSHPITYAESMVPGFFLVLSGGALALQSRFSNVKKSFGLLLSVLLMAGGFLFSQSRGVWVGLAVGILVFGALQGRRFFLTTLLVLLGSISLVLTFSPKIRGRVLSVVSSSSGSVGDQYSKSTRYDLWRGAWNGIKERPLMGHGLRGVKLKSIDPISLEERVWTETHNMYLQITLELGAVGLGLFIWILVVIWWKIWFWRDPLRPAMGGMFVCFLVAGLTESWTKDQEVAMIFWLMMGILMSPFGHEEA
ncbi:MAG: hypothetical protein KCHDKBKB_00155 [Elusimicrobia bacterium]|nr:hypothetical protein [Elusimicrobiota bacterium]